MEDCPQVGLMRPHLRLHVTKKGEWWIGLHAANDRGFTIATTMNYGDPFSACCAARIHWLKWTCWAMKGCMWGAV
jgi:hypothetical protein